MTVEVLYFKGCPNHPLALSRARQALQSVRRPANVVEVEIRNQAEAEEVRFLGSPSVRVNGVDVEPEARSLTTFGMGCRTYVERSLRSGVPSIELIRRALLEQREPAPQSCGSKMFFVSVMLTLLMLAGETFAAQKSPAPTSSDQGSSIAKSELAEKILERLQDIQEKTVAIAGDFPEDLYNTYRPKGNPDVRTAAEILLHVADVNSRVAFRISNKKDKAALAAAGKLPDVRKFAYISKPDTVAKVKESFAALRKAIQDNPDPETESYQGANLEAWLYVIGHSSEHFGNLVTYYRENGLVPPTSRQ